MFCVYWECISTTVKYLRSNNLNYLIIRAITNSLLVGLLIPSEFLDLGWPVGFELQMHCFLKWLTSAHLVSIDRKTLIHFQWSAYTGDTEYSRNSSPYFFVLKYHNCYPSIDSIDAQLSLSYFRTINVIFYFETWLASGGKALAADGIEKMRGAEALPAVVMCGGLQLKG